MSGGQSDGSWVCRQCTFKNTTNVKRCEMCDARASRKSQLKDSKAGSRGVDSGTVEQSSKKKLSRALLNLQSHMEPASSMLHASGIGRELIKNRARAIGEGSARGEVLQRSVENDEGILVDGAEAESDLDSDTDDDDVEVEKEGCVAREHNEFQSPRKIILMSNSGHFKSSSAYDKNEGLDMSDRRRILGDSFRNGPRRAPVIGRSEIPDPIRDNGEKHARMKRTGANENGSDDDNDAREDNLVGNLDDDEFGVVARGDYDETGSDEELTASHHTSQRKQSQRRRQSPSQPGHNQEDLSSQKRRAASGPWDCPMCSFQNPWLRSVCSMCFSPRSSARGSSEVAMGNQGQSPPLLMAAQLKQELHLKKKLENKRRAALRTLARVAASSLASELPFSPVFSEKRRRELESQIDEGKSKRVCSEQTKDRNTSADGRRHHMRPPLPPPTTRSSSTFEVGALLKYAFEDENQTWIWYLGIVLETWPRCPWYKMLFEDGENLWVYLDGPSEGRLWAGIKPILRSAEMVRFEHNLELASPGEVVRLHKQLKKRSSSLPINPGRKQGRPRKHANIASDAGSAEGSGKMERDDEFSIVAAEEAPPNWSHPPSVNSLDPTPVKSSASASSYSSIHKLVPREQLRRQTSVRSSQRSSEHFQNLRRMPKREVSMLTMRNGELFAVLRNDEAVVTGSEEAFAGSAHWVACDRCSKWRRVSESTFRRNQASDAQWLCEQNTDDPSRAACNAPEEKEDDDAGSVPAVVKPPEQSSSIDIASGPLSKSRPWILSADEAYCACLKVSTEETWLLF